MVDQNEAAHYEPPHLDLHCLPCSEFSIRYNLDDFLYFVDVNFVLCVFGSLKISF